MARCCFCGAAHAFDTRNRHGNRLSTTNLEADCRAGRNLNLRAGQIELGGGVDQPRGGGDACGRSQCAYRGHHAAVRHLLVS
jgi:hypothetical protein